jgi:transmembrane sensor
MVESGAGGDRDEQAARDAIAWFVRLNNAGVTEADRRAFRAWLEADPEHERAMAETSALWGDLKEPAARLGQGGWYRQRPRAHARLGRLAAIAACLALAGGVALWRDAGLIDRVFADHATWPGERREFVLADGTRIHLDGDAALRITFAPTLREVTLDRGRAWFDVARDENRPFVVHAGRIGAQALGTAFAVDREAASVTVEEGRVAVEAGGARAVLKADQRAALDADGRLGPIFPVDHAVAGAWRRGLVVLDAAPLGEVAAALSRLEAGRVVIPDADLRKLRLSGTFHAAEPREIVEAMRAALGLKVVRVPGVATVIYR